MVSKLQRRLAELASQREALLAKTPDAELQRLAAEEEALRAELEAAEREEAKRRLAEIRQEVEQLLGEMAPHALAIVELGEQLQGLCAESRQLAFERGIGPEARAPGATNNLIHFARGWLENLDHVATSLAKRYKPPEKPDMVWPIRSADELITPKKGGKDGGQQCFF